jgi:hypothetical protein
VGRYQAGGRRHEIGLDTCKRIVLRYFKSKNFNRHLLLNGRILSFEEEIDGIQESGIKERSPHSLQTSAVAFSTIDSFPAFQRCRLTILGRVLQRVENAFF